ncbi:M24 family metallopeptidase [Parasediminibacterium sp. JCM 36343]|uniref:M24 family metallopeptidase n=1 Tax=Parasediminibacterium sp. JCM 36343 TaxID=3374279 RepID=UPI0039791948
MSIKRRDFIGLASLAAATGITTGFSSFASGNKKKAGGIANSLNLITDDAVPISVNERKNRIAKAQRLLLEQKMEALVLDSGTSMVYFTGIHWGESERAMVAIIPARGDIQYVCPAFEEARFRQQISIGKDVYTWQEDESPYRVVAKIFKTLAIVVGTIGIEEKVRFFVMDGIRKEAPQLTYTSGDPVTIPCRMIKSAAEIKLMQKANDITLAAIKRSAENLKEGMSQSDLSIMIMDAQNELGGKADFALCLFGKASAFPHGLKQPQTLKKGDIVLMDCGCLVEGYNSDITRTIVFGAPPTKSQQEIWNLEKKAQAAGFAAAKIGLPCEAVDAAARAVITNAGFGPGYALPGLPHRTGHGIGMDGHEWGNMVKGNKQLIELGMCFSIEPTIAIVGEFGVRFEDCAYMTEDGPRWFSQPSKSMQEPF